MLLVAELSLDAVFAGLCDLFGSFADATTVELALRRADGAYLHLRHAAGRSYRIDDAALRSDEPVVAAMREPDFLEERDPAGLRGPLLVGDEVVGGMVVRSEGLSAYDELQAAALESLAPYVAVAVRNRMVLDRLERERFRAEHDPLTGLANRALYRDRLAQAIVRSQRDFSNVGVLYIDLDRFKPINDRYGHEAGDAVLREVARRLQSVLRATDTVARLGGDEFACVVERIGERSELHAIIEKITHALIRPVVYKESVLPVSASVGSALFPEDALDDEDLLRVADEAMYQAKSRRVP